MGSNPMPHVVMVPINASGHFTPFLFFAKRLAAEGITVTLACSDKHISDLLRNPETLQLPEGSQIRFLGLRDGSEHLSHREAMHETLRTQAGRDKMIRRLVELITDISSANAQNLRGVPTAAFPVCVMHDMLACWAQEAAEKLHIEKHMLYVSPVAILSIGFQSERLAREGRVPVLLSEAQDITITDIPGLPPLQALDLPSMYLFADMHHWFKYHDNRSGKADVVLVNSFYDLEKQVIDAVRKEVIGTSAVQTRCLFDIGPLALLEPNTVASDSLIQLDAVEETDPCICWLNTQKPSSVLYVCFGSLSTHSAPQLLELALGLEASGQPFLWILRPPGSSPINSSCVVSTPMTEYLPPGFEERVKDRGMCYCGWVSQRQILGHVATGGFLTHCGWNSILESVNAGIPMLTWSFWADQNVNNRFLVDTAKLGIELEREPIDPEQDLTGDGRISRRVRKTEIEKKVCKLMLEEEGQIIRHNVQKMRLKMLSTVASGGLSSRNFENYIRLLHAKNAV